MVHANVQLQGCNHLRILAPYLALKFRRQCMYSPRTPTKARCAGLLEALGSTAKVLELWVQLPHVRAPALPARKPNQNPYAKPQAQENSLQLTHFSSLESQSEPGTKIVYPEPCKEFRRRPQLCMVGIVLYEASSTALIGSLERLRRTRNRARLAYCPGPGISAAYF